jgi:hypothetical protein
VVVVNFSEHKIEKKKMETVTGIEKIFNFDHPVKPID